MLPYTYLLINFFTIVICVIASFDKRIRFNRYFLPYLLAATLVAIPFIFWDSIFTACGVWWFNYNYTTGISIAGLPVEECLFFFCIPFSCVFTYFCMNRFFNLDRWNAFNNLIVFLALIACTVTALLFYNRLYTFVTAVVSAIIFIFLHFIVRREWIGKASFVYILLSPGFFLVNGILTGTGLSSPIVNYNPEEFLGIRMLTIPIEDALYGYILFLMNLYFFELFTTKKRAAFPQLF